MDEKQYEKRGYLQEKFRLFHLCDSGQVEVDYHYHDFHKLVLFLSGDAEYIVEGERCALEPGDLVVVPRGAIHRPVVRPGPVYERVILYLSGDFLREEDEALAETLFSRGHGPVIRTAGGIHNPFAARMKEIEAELGGKRWGCGTGSRAQVLLLLVELARTLREDRLIPVYSAGRDRKSAEIMRYIGEHLRENITVEQLAERFYLSRYHMMRRFREETGTTVYGYLMAKRLMLARDLIAAGASPSEACDGCGYQDYSAFARAYKKQFGVSPRGGTGTHMETGERE